MNDHIKARHLRGVALAAGALLISLSGCTSTASEARSADAEPCEEFPSKPIDLIVPYSAGGGTDQVARAFTSVASKYMDVPVRPLVKPGAGAAIGTQELVDSAPDGYTLAMGTDGSIAGNPLLKEDVDYDLGDFTPVATLSETSFAILVAPDSPFGTIEDLLEAAKTTKLSYGTPNAGGTLSMFMNILAKKAGVSWSEVPFDGSSKAVIAAAGGNVDFAVASSGSSVESVKGGLVRALASTGEKRIPSLPEVPTLTESGVDLVVPAWRVMVAPAGLDQCRLEHLEDLILEVGKDEEFLELASAIEGEPLDVQGSEYTDKMIEEYTAVVQAGRDG